MRCLQITADGRPGGGPTVVLSLLRGLGRSGMELCLVTQKDSYLLDSARKMGFPVAGVDFFRSRVDLRPVRDLARWIRGFRPDLIHLHGTRAGFFFSWAPVRQGVVVYSNHGYHFQSNPWPIQCLAALGEHRALRRADMPVFASFHDQKLARKWKLLDGAREARMIPCGIQVPYSGVSCSAIPRTVGFLGRLHVQKDPLLFVAMMHLLVDEGYTAKIIGGGELRGQVEALIRKKRLGEHVKLLGPLPHREGIEAIRDVSVLVLPSRWEAGPLSIKEAMSLGIPVVAADVGGVDEVIETEKSGILVREHTPHAYADAVRRLESNPDLRKQIINRARVVFDEQFHEDTMVARYRSLYEELVEQKGKSPYADICRA